MPAQTFDDIMKSTPPTGQTEDSFSIYKTDDDKRLVFGWASISITVDGEQLEDRQNDLIDPEDLEEAAYEYVLNFRDTGEEHIPTMRKKGKLVESCVFTAEKQQAMGIPAGTLPVGWWIGFKIEDDDAWSRVKSGVYKMFSIEGRATREPVEKSVDTVGSVAKTFDEILKFNPYHDARGRFTSANGFASFSATPGKSKAHDNAIARRKEMDRRDSEMRAGRSYGETDTKDALGEKDRTTGQLADNSLRAHMDENGNLTPEREALHKEIIDKMLYGKEGVDGQATMTMLGGGPASGKSSVMSTDTSKDPHAVTVNPDIFKEHLPGYKEMAAKDSSTSSYYHEESSALAKRFYEVAVKENINVIYDGTGDGSENSVTSKISTAREKGYRVEAKYVSIDTDTAVQRNQKRYEDQIAEGKNPRLVPEHYVRSTHQKCTDISVAMADKFDHIEIWDNNGARGEQKMIASGGNGKGLKVVSGQQAAFDAYLDKGAKGKAGFITLPDGQVVPATE